MIIRHLVLSGHFADFLRVLRWIAANLPTDTYVSLMAQYSPTHLASAMPTLNRRLRAKEYEQVVPGPLETGLENGFVQELEAASGEYVPKFNLDVVREDK